MKNKSSEIDTQSVARVKGVCNMMYSREKLVGLINKEIGFRRVDFKAEFEDGTELKEFVEACTVNNEMSLARVNEWVGSQDSDVTAKECLFLIARDWLGLHDTNIEVGD